MICLNEYFYPELDEECKLEKYVNLIEYGYDYNFVKKMVDLGKCP